MFVSFLFLGGFLWFLCLFQGVWLFFNIFCGFFFLDQGGGQKADLHCPGLCGLMSLLSLSHESLALPSCPCHPQHPPAPISGSAPSVRPLRTSDPPRHPPRTSPAPTPRPPQLAPPARCAVPGAAAPPAGPARCRRSRLLRGDPGTYGNIGTGTSGRARGWDRARGHDCGRGFGIHRITVWFGLKGPSQLPSSPLP